MLRSLPKNFNLIHFIYRENRLATRPHKRIIERNLRVMYRYSHPKGCVTGYLTGTSANDNKVRVELDNGIELWRKAESFDLIDKTGKIADYIIEYYK